jgi:hypothetical protein
MLGENAIECFGFDRQKMAAIAKRIGPAPESVIGHHAVDPALIAHFDLRSGYSKPPAVIDPAPLMASLNQDLVGVGNSN